MNLPSSLPSHRKGLECIGNALFVSIGSPYIVVSNREGIATNKGAPRFNSEQCEGCRSAAEEFPRHRFFHSECFPIYFSQLLNVFDPGSKVQWSQRLLLIY